MNLDNLTREELLELATDLISTQARYYNQVKLEKISANDAFYQLAGSFQVLRLRAGLAPLYERTSEWS